MNFDCSHVEEERGSLPNRFVTLYLRKETRKLVSDEYGSDLTVGEEWYKMVQNKRTIWFLKVYHMVPIGAIHYRINRLQLYPLSRTF